MAGSHAGVHDFTAQGARLTPLIKKLILISKEEQHLLLNITMLWMEVS